MKDLRNGYAVGDNDEGAGTLFVTDIRLLVRPATTDQYHKVPHDASHAYRLLNLGNNGGLYEWHLVSPFDPKTTHAMLDRVFYAYVDACCFDQWCDARVRYNLGNETVAVDEYGFSDGLYRMIFNVYCESDPDDERLLDELTDKTAPGDEYIIVRPDSSDKGYSIDGFTLEDPSGLVSEEDERDDDEWEDDDELCEGICGQPASACTCTETVAFKRHNADSETSGSIFIA